MGRRDPLTEPLNSPLEVGVRLLTLLVEAFPDALDVSRLVLLDYALLHSADLGGPESLHPPLPLRSGELGVRRRSIETGLEPMLRAGLIESVTTAEGILFQAADRAERFISVLQSPYAVRLRERATWCLSDLGSQDTESLRTSMRTVIDAWSEELDEFPTGAP